MSKTVFIDGAAGTTGLEIRDRLQTRGEFSLVTLGDDDRKNATKRQQALCDADIAILCLPDNAAREAVTLAASADTRIIDASSAHRVADGWTYGFPELLGHEAIAQARYVSNPGCYPTGFLALVAPLVKAGTLPANWPYTVNAVSGYSGGGNAMINRFETEETIAFRTYGLGLKHKHLPEMKAHAGLVHPVLFAPSVIPAHRGMIVEVPLHLGAMAGNLRADQLRDELTAHYAGSKIVTVADGDAPAEILLHKNAEPWDGMELLVCGNDDGSNARLIARLDNLGKGASGAAIQNLNLMCGIDEAVGLKL